MKETIRLAGGRGLLKDKGDILTTAGYTVRADLDLLENLDTRRN